MLSYHQGIIMKRATEESLVLSELPVEGYEKVVVATDERSGLQAIICIHNSTLGPTLGGIRIFPYPNFESALTDAKRLARGMTYKSAMAGVGFGGAKSVIIAHPKNKTPEMLIAFAEAVRRLRRALYLRRRFRMYHSRCHLDWKAYPLRGRPLS